MIVFLDGEFLPEEEAKISLFDRGFLLGDGLYATIQVNNGVPYFLKKHLIRLEQQAKEFGLVIPELKESWVMETIDRNKAFQGVYKMKVVLTGGDDPDMGLPKRRQGHIAIFLKPITLSPYAPLALAIYPEVIQTPHATFKSLAHLSRYYVMQYGRDQGCDDAITLSPEGYILEASFGNLLWVEGKSAFTPDPKLPYHFGMTVSEVMQLLESQGFTIQYVKTREISTNASVYRVNTMSGIRPVTRIGGVTFPRHLDFERELVEAYVNQAQRHPWFSASPPAS